MTPMMAQWQQCKEKAKEAVLLFRMGDFYEAFYDDAELLARELELTLTKRQEIPMAGVPHHTLDGYVGRLVAKGFCVAIAEQTEDPKQTKKLVQREVVRIVTPGTVVDSSLISEKASHYVVSLAQVGHLFGLAVLELSTGLFKVTECEQPVELVSELARLQAAEVLVSEKFKARHQALLEGAKSHLTCKPDWWFDHQTACEMLRDQFGVHTLDGFGLKGMVAAINAAGGLVSYVKGELACDLNHVAKVIPYSITDSVALDPITQRNLMLVGATGEPSLLKVLDRTATAMGGRLLREWANRPLRSVRAIQERQQGVKLFYERLELAASLTKRLRQVRDLERLAMKVSTGLALPRDLKALGHSLEQLPGIKQLLRGEALLEPLVSRIIPLSELAALVKSTLAEEPPVRLSDGGVIRAGISAELDELRDLQRDGKAWMAAYRERLQTETGIKTLKVGYNRVFGYFIEVSKGQADRMPDHFTRRQTLVNAERFISPELKEYESKVLSAEERIAMLESELYTSLRNRVAADTTAILQTAGVLARLDGVLSFATVAHERNYVQPQVDSSTALQIEAGRHPVVEAVLGSDPFMPNHTQLDGDTERLMLITGPNMAGKSTYIRQVALIVLMAQMGSFVPARSAHIGVVDQLFTRIGASDDLARGQSTFMVEMTETANILNNATDHSLIILDEIGRGTSTYDGISIAWAVAEHLLVATRAKTLFATHYFELTQLEGKIPGAVNYSVAVREERGTVIFLHKIVKGSADRSYGVHVGRLAGLPSSVVARAQQILRELEEEATGGRLSQKGTAMIAPDLTQRSKQLTLFSS